MQEVFDKIIEEFEEKHEQYINTYGIVGGNPSALAVKVCIDTVREIAEQYNNGWIPCSVRLPEGRQDVLVCFDNIDGCIIAWYAPNGRTWRNSSTDNICKADPIAWMNLPAPYQQKGENDENN